MSFYRFCHKICQSCEDSWHVTDRSSIAAAGMEQMDYRLDVCRVTKGGHSTYEERKENFKSFSFHL
jgi:hypothetical protein